MTKVDLVTGILGCGKTTWLHRYAAYLIQQGQRIAILENDFGAVNVDLLMLQDLKGPQCKLEVISGGGDADCHKRRFKTQMIALGMQHFDRILIEPSGIYDMDEFFDTLHESPLDRWFEIGSIIGILDASLEDTLSEEMEFLLASEAACCGALVLSKLPDFCNGTQTEQITARVLQHVNQALADIQCQRKFSQEAVLAKPWNTLQPEDYQRLSEAGYRSEAYVKKYDRESIRSQVHYFMNLRIPVPVIPKVIGEILSDRACGRIFRIKGALPAEEEGNWYRLNATADLLELSPIREGQAVLIVIGEKLNRIAIDQHFQQYNQEEAYQSI